MRSWGKFGKDGDNERFQLWSEFWPPNPDDPATPHGDEAARRPRRRRGDRRAAQPPGAVADAVVVRRGQVLRHRPLDPTEKMVGSLDRGSRGQVRRRDQPSSIELQWHLDGVARVRRLLANIPSFMIFDDHEVTDDWNITPRWAKQTRANALGRAVIRNALAACTVFQSWGNDPRPTDRGPVGRTVLDRDRRAVPGPARRRRRRRRRQLRPSSWSGCSTCARRAAGGQRMLWHFRYDGPGFEVIALDTRTWRGFEPEANETIRERFSDEATATLLTDEALRMQIPEQPAIGVNPDGVCFVIAAAPFIGYPIVESIVQPLINLHDIAKAGKPDPPFVRWQRSFSVGRVARDPENWGFVPSLFEAVLARLSTPPARRVPVRRRALRLHHADGLLGARPRLGAAHGDTRRAADRQLVPRPARRPRPARGHRPRPADRRGHVGADPPRVAPRRHRFHHRPRRRWSPAPTRSPRTCQSLLTEDPIVVSYEGIPATARFLRDPEWAWSTAAIADQRSDEDRFSQVDPPPPFSPGTEADLVRSVGERHFWASQLAMPRQLAVVDELHHGRLHPTHDRRQARHVAAPHLRLRSAGHEPVDARVHRRRRPPRRGRAASGAAGPAMSVTPGTILKTAAKITVDTFVTLGDIMSDPASAHDYCDAVGVPPFPGGEWSAAVAELRAKADAADDPEQWAEIINLGAKVINGLQKAIGGSAPGAPPGPWSRRSSRSSFPCCSEVSRKVSPTLHTLLALAFFTDQRLQDSFPEGLFAERWYHVLGSLASAAGWGHADPTDPETTVVDWAPIVSDAAAVAITVLAVVFDNQGFKDHLVRFWYGFDHPPIPGQEHAQGARPARVHACCSTTGPPGSPRPTTTPASARSRQPNPRRRSASRSCPSRNGRTRRAGCSCRATARRTSTNRSVVASTSR